jgi:hypothetical protein
MRVTKKYGGCSDGPCPTIYDLDDPALVAVQGATLTDSQALADIGDIPGHENVVILPSSLLDTYVEQRS